VSLALYLAPDAEADIDDIVEWSVGKFGVAVRNGYEELINTAIESILATRSISEGTSGQNSAEVSGPPPTATHYPPVGVVIARGDR
jgi:plasmid stabilization system protein ParE